MQVDLPTNGDVCEIALTRRCGSLCLLSTVPEAVDI